MVTHPKILAPPSPRGAAVKQVDAWLESSNLGLLSEAVDYRPLLRAAITAAKMVGPQVHDGLIAALCAQHGVRELRSADRDFNRFAGMTVINPLIAK
jgi:uncharacterized protein